MYRIALSLVAASLLLQGCSTASQSTSASRAASTGVPPGELSEPWKLQHTVLIIDHYQENIIDWDEMARDRRVAAIIHRASIGMRVDTRFRERSHEAKSRGYLWGAYHLGTAGDPIAQADLFLSVVGDSNGTLLALDLESLSGPDDMTIPDALRFMERIRNRTGRTPVIYANDHVSRILSRDSRFVHGASGSKLWYARYLPAIPSLPDGLWSRYFLWQFTSHHNCYDDVDCPYRVPGTQRDMDVNVFFGTRAELAREWTS